MNTKKKLASALAALAILGTVAPGASAQQGQSGSYYGYGMGPGMMGGWCPGCGMGPGMMGMGRGMMGPGMMGGWGMGSGMMDGRSMGPGMMGMGRNMMWDDWDDWDDRHMGRGMMGRGMMGPGMMGGYGYGPALDLTEQQQAKIAQIQEDFRKKQWDLAAKTDAEYAKLNEIYYSGKRDPAVIDSQYKKIYDLRRQLVQASLEAQNRIDAVLTKEQQERLRGYGPAR